LYALKKEATEWTVLLTCYCFIWKYSYSVSFMGY